MWGWSLLSQCELWLQNMAWLLLVLTQGIEIAATASVMYDRTYSLLKVTSVGGLFTSVIFCSFISERSFVIITWYACNFLLIEFSILCGLWITGSSPSRTASLTPTQCCCWTGPGKNPDSTANWCRLGQKKKSEKCHSAGCPTISFSFPKAEAFVSR